MSKTVNIEEQDGNINITCAYCNSPIIKSNDYGMDCENDCNQKAVIKLITENKSFSDIFKLLK